MSITTQPIFIGKNHTFTLQHFYAALHKHVPLALNDETKGRLIQTRRFVDHLLNQNDVRVYGLNTGFADLRDRVVSKEEASVLSENLLLSHDAGIGESFSADVILGAMILRANSLAKGHSAIQVESLETLLAMIEHQIIPDIPCTGSLGASGDLAFLARLGRAMQGHEVTVSYKGKRMDAGEALTRAGIRPFEPAAKEGLAMTNGTSFMASMMAIGLQRFIHTWENLFATMTLHLCATSSVDAAFSGAIQQVRGQHGQVVVAEIFRSLLEGSPFLDKTGVQDDYSQRCLPQILGPKIEMVMALFDQIEAELDAVTDNPLLFCNEEISPDIAEERILTFEGDRWCVLSGGNFHGETSSTVADAMRLANAKLALTLERQLTYLCNPGRNKGKLPIYLIPDAKNIGLHSGLMLTQYTANSLVQQICHKATPTTNFNLTSGNEAEDIVSYGASSAHLLLEQLELMEQLTTIHAIATTQAYAIVRESVEVHEELTSERLFALMGSGFPLRKDQPFAPHYKTFGKLLATDSLRACIGYPLAGRLGYQEG